MHELDRESMAMVVFQQSPYIQEHIHYIYLYLQQGNHLNRLVILDNKIVDCVNYILKQSLFEGCSTVDLLRLKRGVVSLLISLVEESNQTAVNLAKVHFK